ncbi:MAG: leucine-rich repeat protein [Clostridia bacterium]|nr:leucine-rich repeat protein [Clostridia bacterium]
MDENNQSQNEHVYSTVAKNAYILPEPPQRNKTPWIIGIVIAILVSFGLGVGFCLWMLRDMAPTEDTVVTKAPELPSAPHITDVADIPETPAEDMTPEDATATPADPPEDTNGAPVDPPATVAPEASIQTAPEPETPPKPDDPVDPESTDAPDIPVEPETTACAHEYSDWQITAPATCTGAGLQTQSCQLCGEERKEPIEPTGHTEITEVLLSPTCTTWGISTTYCLNCEFQGDSLPLSPTEHTEITEVLLSPTCTTWGISTTYCLNCEFQGDPFPLSPIGHTPGEWIIDQEPALGIEGSRHTTCTVCGTTIEETIEMLYSQGLTYVSNGEGTCYVSGIGTCTDTDVVIPTTYKGLLVTGIGNQAFYSSDITSINIPDSVTSIGDHAFEGCSGLTSIDIPTGVTSIGYCAFSNCSNLASIALPDTVTSVGIYAFIESYNLASVYYAGTLEQWCSIVFENANSNPCCNGANLYFGDILVEKVEITSSITALTSTFSGCTSLTSVSFSEGNQLTTIGEYAFSKCVNLTNIEIPSNITCIGRRAFEHCTSLTNISFGVNSQLTYIKDYAFAWCENLKSITIPDSVTNIKEWAFTDCTKLESVYYEGDLDQWCSIAFENFGSNPLSDYRNHAYLYINNKKVEGVISPNVYNDFAFSDYSYLTGITLPDGVTAIVDYAFSNCINMTTITIPRSVTSIEDSAFYGNTPITDIFYMGTEEEWEAITKGTYWEPDTDYTLHFNYVP